MQVVAQQSRNGELRFRTLIEQLTAIIYTAALDEHSSTLYVSPQIEVILGFTPEEWMADPELWLKQIHPEDCEKVLAAVAQAQASDTPVPLEYRALTRDGRVVWMHDTASVVRDDAGIPLFLQGVSVDITERKRAEEERSLREAQLIDAQRLARLGSWEWDIATKTVTWSDEMYRIYGVDPESFPITFEAILGIIHPDDRADVAACVNQARADGTSYLNEHRIIRPDGETRVLQARGVTVLDAAGQAVRMYGTSQDITERKQAEAARRAIEERYRSLIEATPSAIVVADMDTRISMVTPQAVRLFGFDTPDEMLGRSVFELIVPEDHEKATHKIQRAVTHGSGAAEYSLLRKDGSRFLAELHAAIISNEAGQPQAITGVLRDITEQRLAEFALREREAHYRSLIEVSPDAIVQVDLRGTILTANQQTATLLKYAHPDELIGRTAFDFIAPEDGERAHAGLEQTVTLGEVRDHQYTVVRNDGIRRTVEFNARLVVDAEGTPQTIIAVVRDITERKQAEAALFKREAQLNEAQHLAQLGSWEWDIAAHTITWSDALYRIYGVGPETFSNTYEAILAHIHPDDRASIAASVNGARADGTSYLNEHRIIRPDGETRLLQSRGVAILDGEGHTIRMHGTSQDITERKRAEEEISRRNRELSVLNTIAIAANESSDLLALLTTTLEQIVTIAAVDGVECWLARTDGVLELVATCGLAAEFVRTTQEGRFTGDQGLPHLALASGAPVYVADAQADERYPRRNLARAAGYRSLLCVPICGGGAPLGAFTLYSSEPRTFAPQLQTLLMTIGGQLSVAIERARLYEAERQRRAQLARSNALIAALSRVAAHIETTRDPGRLVETLGAELEQLGTTCLIALLDPDTRDLVIRYTSIAAPALALIDASIGQPVCGFHLRRERLLIYDDLFANRRVQFLPDAVALVSAVLPDLPRVEVEHILGWAGVSPGIPLIFLPLTVEHGVLGFLAVWSADLREDDVPVLSVFAGQVASAIENARLFEQIHAGREHLRQLSQQIIVAQEEERRRVARELHDESGQALTALKIRLEMLKAGLPGADATLRRQLATAVAMVDATMERMRSLALVLRPPALDALGLNAALEGYCQSFAEHTRLVVDYAAVELPIVPDPIGICLYRFLQEALTNIAKHAHARRVWIVLQRDAEQISLAVEDDGDGFDPPTLRSNTDRLMHMGLLGMRERLQLLGGRLDVDLQPGRGVHLVAHIPWRDSK